MMILSEPLNSNQFLEAPLYGNTSDERHAPVRAKFAQESV